MVVSGKILHIEMLSASWEYVDFWLQKSNMAVTPYISDAVRPDMKQPLPCQLPNGTVTLEKMVAGDFDMTKIT